MNIVGLTVSIITHNIQMMQIFVYASNLGYLIGTRGEKRYIVSV